MANPRFRNPAAIPNARKISVHQGETSKYRSRAIPTNNPIKIENATEKPILLK